ncbi:MAG TPA: hypothetical protein VMC10_21870 [Stellaceae bacterium]|nr:hypothetical protein [Stellaceae bacterium]
MHALWKLAAGLALVLTTAACSGSGSDEIRCPRAAIVPELKSVAKFAPGTTPDPQAVAYGGRMTTASLSCEYDDKKHGLTVSSTLAVVALRSKPDVRKGQITYFVAVVDRRSNILNERDFVIDLTFPAKQDRLDISEEHEEFIPMPKTGTGADYGILFGFRLTPEELKFVRDHEQQGPG